MSSGAQGGCRTLRGLCEECVREASSDAPRKFKGKTRTLLKGEACGTREGQ